MEILTERVTRSERMSWVATLMLLGSVACGRPDTVSGPDVAPTSQEQQLVGGNGLTQNGLTQNGLTQNGLTQNGLATNGLETADFAGWFSQDGALNATVMKYLVQCALPAGETRGYQDASTGTSYLWEGGLGLATGWASGQPMSEAEQQLVSACMAAHVNKYGLHVSLSVLGRTAQQEPIPYTAEELQNFPRREGCFFGNLFTGEGVFAATDGEYLDEAESSPRACALSTRENASVSECSPIVHVNSCEQYCTLDPSGLFYTQCTYNGRTYLPLTTRIRSEDVYTCGDGVCQFTESCGSDTRANSCMNDCGRCP
ncbi:hypothetical protein [Hyalangium versicolor]|uniref:hypothetical protein n=1 Tax=Hyalangium versicolor TaxID=2861190 RepID=UPI001CCD0C35|nr:hypothetical protein [Hyalangium versicolor]